MSVSLPTSDPDVWVAEAIRSGGLGGVRLRETCDHEATAAALGYTLSSARVDRTGPHHGEVRYLPPRTVDADRRRMEELIITVAPRALGAVRSSGDSCDAMDLARELAGNGVACLATGRATGEVLDLARRDALALAETKTFRVVREVVRQALEKYGALDQDDLETVVRRATGASQKRKASAKPQPRRPAPKTTPTRRNRCAGCGMRTRRRAHRGSVVSAEEAPMARDEAVHGYLLGLVPRRARRGAASRAKLASRAKPSLVTTVNPSGVRVMRPRHPRDRELTARIPGNGAPDRRRAETR
jgi:hypothetical protein